MSAALAGFASLTSPGLFAHGVGPLEAAPTKAAAGAKTEATAGVVREIVIEDHVAGMTMRHLSMVPASGKPVALAGSLIDNLTAGQAVFVTGRRNGNTLFVDTVQAGKTVAVPVPASEHVEGKLAMAHVDDFEHGTSDYVYEVRGDDGSVTGLDLPVAPAALQAGMRVRAHGNRASQTEPLDPSRIEVLALAAAGSGALSQSATAPLAVTAKAATVHSVLVVAVKFTDTATDPATIASLQSLMTTAPDAVAKFFNEASYGQHQLSVTVPTVWLRGNIATPTTCNYSAISTAGDAAATAAGYNPANYDFKVYMFPRVSACGWSGLGYVGAPHIAYINGPTSFLTKVVAHEMGHNFGLLHAASLDCGARAVGGTCTASEYGDPFNTMGNMTSMHYASAQKSLLGWISSTAVKTHTSGTATYVINALESAGGSVYAVKIPAAAKRTYWIEYRQPLGFDAGLSAYPTNGAQIRVASPFETISGSDDTELLDLTTGTTAFTDAALTVGKSYVDPDYGITITAVSATASALTVQVSGPGSSSPPAPAATTTGIGASANPSNWGLSVTFTATVTGTSPTGTVAFMDSGSAIAGCATVALAGSGNTRTATCTTSALAVGTHNMSAKYAGDTANATSTSTTLSESITSTTTTNTNVAAASAGATATASSTLSGYDASHAINGAVAGARTSTDLWWNDATPSQYPDWLQVTFSASKVISSVIVYSLQDNYTSGVAPTDTTTFTAYGLQDFSVQGWNGSTWVTLGSVTGNNLVKRTISFAAFTTNRIRVNVTRAASGYSRIVEVQAMGH